MLTILICARFPLYLYFIKTTTLVLFGPVLSYEFRLVLTNQNLTNFSLTQDNFSPPQNPTQRIFIWDSTPRYVKWIILFKGLFTFQNSSLRSSFPFSSLFPHNSLTLDVFHLDQVRVSPLEL